MMTHPALVFDLGGVLIDWNPRHLYRKLFHDETQMEWFLHSVCSPEWNSLQDEGRPFEEAVRELVGHFPRYESFIRAYHERWDETVKGSIPGTVVILERLYQEGRTLHALSNWSAETFPRVLPRFEFLARFQHILISGEAGVRKPDPRFFALFLERVQRPAHDCLFIDDSEENISVASKLGFATILFHSPLQLETELRKRELLK